MIGTIILGILGFCIFLVYTSAFLENAKEYNPGRSSHGTMREQRGKIARFMSSISSALHSSASGINEKGGQQQNKDRNRNPPGESECQPVFSYCRMCHAKLRKHMKQRQENTFNNNINNVLSESTGGVGVGVTSALSVIDKATEVENDGSHCFNKMSNSTESEKTVLENRLQSTYNPFQISTNIPSHRYGEPTQSEKFAISTLDSTCCASTKPDGDTSEVEEDPAFTNRRPNLLQPAVSVLETLDCYESPTIGIFSKVGSLTGFSLMAGESKKLVTSVLKAAEEDVDPRKMHPTFPTVSPPQKATTVLGFALFDDGVADSSEEGERQPAAYEQHSPDKSRNSQFLQNSPFYLNKGQQESSIQRREECRKTGATGEGREEQKKRRTKRTDGEQNGDRERRRDERKRHKRLIGKKQSGGKFVEETGEDCLKGHNNLRDKLGGDEMILLPCEDQ